MYRKLNSSTSTPAVVTGAFLAKQTPAGRLAALIAIAADQATLGRPTHRQLAMLAGLSENEFRKARRQYGAPISVEAAVGTQSQSGAEIRARQS